MKLIPIKVECYAGYKADEYPVCFYQSNTRFEVLEILDRWNQTEYLDNTHVSDYFKVHTNMDKPVIVKHDIKDDKWYLLETRDE